MRPVDKGDAPKVTFKKYQDAEPYLEEKIGAYCSFCEFNIQHVPEVEHKEAKSQGGEELEWGNLLLSCKYCNTRKSTMVSAGEKDKYLWPDEDDTFHAFSYATEIPVLNQSYLEKQEEIVQCKARNLFALLKLDNVPISPREKDRRYSARNEARNCALESRDGWYKVKNTADRDIYFRQIIILAKAKGFFSIWMEVFKDDAQVRNALIEAFEGTRREYCEG